MVSTAELGTIGIIDWNLIKAKYEKPNLLLGNGFSLQFSTKFSYGSLFEIFLDTCDATHKSLFSHFGTSNFELILRYLTQARIINSHLSLPTQPIDVAILQLKNGLIRAIEYVHPRIHEIDFDQLEEVANQLADFGDIFTTNYDLYLYHIIMKSLDISKYTKGYVPYQDYYWGGHAKAGFLEFVNYQNYTYKHLYYLHGSLFIFKQGLMDVKIKRSSEGTELIDKIADEIRNNNIPNFVSEGAGDDKRKSITQNDYLRFCIEKLKVSTKPILVFGNSLGEFDSHILEAIKVIPKEIIYCIYVGNRTLQDLHHEKLSFTKNFNSYPKTIDFVDSKTVFAI